MDDEAIWCFFVSPKVMKIISLPIRIQVMWGRSVQRMSKDTYGLYHVRSWISLPVCADTHTHKPPTNQEGCDSFKTTYEKFLVGPTTGARIHFIFSVF